MSSASRAVLVVFMGKGDLGLLLLFMLGDDSGWSSASVGCCLAAWLFPLLSLATVDAQRMRGIWPSLSSTLVYAWLNLGHVLISVVRALYFLELGLRLVFGCRCLDEELDHVPVSVTSLMACPCPSTYEARPLVSHEIGAEPISPTDGVRRRKSSPGMTKGWRLQLPSAAFVRGGRGTGGRGRSDSPDRGRVNTRDIDDCDRRNSRDAEDRHPKPPSAELTREKEVKSDFPQESQKRRQLAGPIDFQDPIGGRESAVPLGGSACGSSSSMIPASYAKERIKYEMVEGRRVELDPSGHILPRELYFAGPQPKITGLPHPDEGFICCEANALALAQAMANVSLADKRVYRQQKKGRMPEWMGRDLNWNLAQRLNIAGQLINVSQEAIGSLKKAKNQSTSRLTALEKAQSRCEKLERKIERLERRITELEQQHPSSMDEMVDLWQASEEGKVAIVELSRLSTKAGMAYQHFASYLSEVPANKKWDGLPWPHDDIDETDQNIPYYIADGPPPPIVMDAEEEGEPGEVNIVDP
ncbi:hypothetical protein Dimus_020120 [Dionaea muscipula]